MAGKRSRTMSAITVEELVIDNSSSESSQTPYALENLDSNHKYHNIILADFELAGKKVKKIEKLTNKVIAESYMAKRNEMNMQRGQHDPEYKLNEKYLYHGCNAASLSQIYLGGLDDSFASEGCYGKGIYFSDNIEKCLKYANRSKGDEGFILCVRTILGTSKDYGTKQDRDLVAEPKKEGNFKGFRFYCSVTARPRGFNEFVIYKKNQVLIEYVITYYKCSKTTVDEAAQPKSDAKQEVAESSLAADAVDSSSESDTDSEDDTSPDTYDDEGSEQNKKRKTFKEGTGEKKKYVIDSFLEVADFDENTAIDLYKKREEIERQMEEIRKSVEAGEIQDKDENGKELTFHPDDKPHYGSKEWEVCSEDHKKSYMDSFLSIFMSAIELDVKNRSFAETLLENNKYDIDNTIVSYYNSIRIF